MIAAEFTRGPSPTSLRVGSLVAVLGPTWRLLRRPPAKVVAVWWQSGRTMCQVEGFEGSNGPLVFPWFRVVSANEILVPKPELDF